MSMDDLDKIVAEAKSTSPKVRVTGGVSPEEIEQFEVLVGKLPPPYKYFLSKYGTFGFYGLEIYGLIKGNITGEGSPNAYFMTKSDLEGGSIPQGHVVVASTGYGPVFLLRCATGEVVGWNYTGEVDDELPTFRSFEAFLHDAASRTIADFKVENGQS